MHVIIFNRNNPNWNSDENFNLLFLKAQEQYLNDLAKLRGYLYFNQIYEALGVCWNPEEENECLKYNKRNIFQFRFELFLKKDGELRIFILTPRNES